MEHKSELTELIEELKTSQNSELTYQKISAVLRKYSLEDKWVATIGGTNNEILTHEVDGKQFIPIFSDDKYIVAKGNNVMYISINKIITGLISNTKLAGLEMNPFSANLCIETGGLLQVVFGTTKYYDEEKKDWGLGIPKYDETDIIDKRSLLDFAIQTIGMCEKKENVQGVFYTNEVNANPNIIIEKDGKLAFVLSEADVYPNMPQLSFEKRKELLRRSKQFGFDCYYAPVSFMPSDLLRAEKSLALRGDAFYADYKGLEKVEEIYN